MFSRLNLRWRLLLGVALFFLPVLVVQAWSADDERARAVRDARQQALSLAQVAEANYSQVVLAGEAALEVLADTPPVQMGSGAECNDLLRIVGQSHPAFAAFSVADVDGRLTCSGSPDRIGLNIADREYFHRALLTGGTVSSGFLLSRATGAPTVTLATPIASAEEIAGVLILALDLGWFSEVFGNLDLPPGSSLRLTGAGGDDLIHLTDGEPDGGESVTAEQTLRRTAITDGVDGFVSVSIPRAEVIGGANARMWRNLAVLGGATGFLGLLSFVVVTATVQAPLNRLVGFTRQLSGGDFDARAATGALDAPEVVQLTEAMNVSAEALSLFERSLLDLATVDPLTGLANRIGFAQALAGLFDEARDAGERVTVGVVGIRAFTAINATLGFEVGDRVLQGVGSRIVEALEPGAIVARLSGDSFVVAQRVWAGEVEPLALALRLHYVLTAPLIAGSTVLRVRPYIGVADFPADGDQPERLIRRAELASRRARDDAQRWARFDLGRDEPDREQVHLLDALQGALERSELEVHYQPKVALASGALSGVEALVRWRRDGEYVSPARFIPIAEQAGMIPDLTRAVLGMVVQQLAAWRNAGHDVHVSVNISVLDLADDEFTGMVEGLLARWGVPPGLLELEITETALLREAATARAAAERLTAMGIALTVDDYGVGFAPLTYLTAFPLRAIKLDRAFVADLVTSEQSRTIVAATIAMAHGLGLEVVAEGVETQDVADILRGLGCDHAQGYGFAYPGPAAEVARFAGGATPAAWLPGGGVA
ncbi:MAG: hypothetical protein AMXMBFR23_20340 [Chloroflexota bacterium]